MGNVVVYYFADSRGTGRGGVALSLRLGRVVTSPLSRDGFQPKFGIIIVSRATSLIWLMTTFIFMKSMNFCRRSQFIDII